MKNLVIVESPSKSKTIEKYLGKDFKVTSSKGHICDLATKGKEGLGVDVENDFAPTYEISKDKKEVVKELKKLVEGSDFVYLATDPDREGEAISWHLARELGLDLNEKNRIVFNETPGASYQDTSFSFKVLACAINLGPVQMKDTSAVDFSDSGIFRVISRILEPIISKILQIFQPFTAQCFHEKLAVVVSQVFCKLIGMDTMRRDHKKVPRKQYRFILIIKMPAAAFPDQDDLIVFVGVWSDAPIGLNIGHQQKAVKPLNANTGPVR